MRVLVACECSGIVRNAFRRRGHDAWSCDIKPTEASGPHIQGDVRRVLGDGWDLMIAHPDCTYLSISAEWAYGPGPYHQKVKPETLTGEARKKARDDALNFFGLLLNYSIPKVCIENPVGIANTWIKSPCQTIQPWMFGEDASKATCLWLRGLPKLKPTKIVPPKSWVTVVSAFDLPPCECCEEPYCPVHDDHYADCECVGPTQDGATYRSIHGHEFATMQNPAPRPVWANQTPGGQNKLGPSKTRAADRARTYKGIADAMADQWGS